MNIFKENEIRVKNMLNEFDLLTVAFVCFKVLGLIDWSWWQVFIPYYVLIGASVLVGIIRAMKEA